MSDLKTVIKLHSLMCQSARSKMGLMPAPEEKTVRDTLKEYFREKNVEPVNFNTLPEMMAFISDIVHEEIYSHR